MIEKTAERIRVSHDDGSWDALFPAEGMGGPLALTFDAHVLVRDCGNYIDDLTDQHAVLRRVRASREGGAAVIHAAGYLPFGNEIHYTQIASLAANHLRCTYDLEWPKLGLVRRHFGIGSLTLPGSWRCCWCVPPALHLAEGAVVTCQPLPTLAADAKPLMVGHWHRPPLMLVLERSDGTRLELGTGSDLWRWEHSLGAGVESGSYKLFAEPGGLRFVREPLMCCAEFAPEARKYRFTWYAAWSRPGPAAAIAVPAAETLTFGPDGDLVLPKRPTTGGESKSKGKSKSKSKSKSKAGLKAADDGFRPCWRLDFAAVPAPETCRRISSPVNYGRSIRDTGFCWESDGVQKRARRAIRQIAAAAGGGVLLLQGVRPGICWDPAHLDKNRPEGLVHWDINAIFDFAVWTRQTLGDRWQIVYDPGATPAFPGEAATDFWPPPSLTGLFQANGFRAPALAAGD